MKNKNQYFAEVVESSLGSWVAQSWNWSKYPQYGSLVAIDTVDKTIFALVYDIKTGSGDFNRYPIAYQKTEEELLSEFPNIFEFLKTNFYCLPIGYSVSGKYYQVLPPEPAKIHAFIRLMESDEKRQFFIHADFMPLIFNSNVLADTDELLLALIRNLITDSVFNEALVQDFIEIFSLMSGNDYKRLKIFSKRVSQFL